MACTDQVMETVCPHKFPFDVHVGRTVTAPGRVVNCWAAPEGNLSICPIITSAQGSYLLWPLVSRGNSERSLRNCFKSCGISDRDPGHGGRQLAGGT